MSKKTSTLPDAVILAAKTADSLRMISNALENGQNDPVDLAGLADLAWMLADRMTDLAVFLDGLEVAQPPATGQANRAEMGKIING